MATMIELFKAAGFSEEEVLAFPESQAIPPRISIEVLAYNLGKKEVCWDKVSSLFYKGMSNPSNSYQVFNDKQTFLATGDHLLWDSSEGRYRPLKDLPEDFSGLNEKNEDINIKIIPVEESFPILDIEVEENSNYFSGGILSHNSFGKTAALFSQGLRKLNPYLSRFGTSLLLLNQVRDNIGGFAMPGMKPECVAPDTLIEVCFE